MTQSGKAGTKGLHRSFSPCSVSTSSVSPSFSVYTLSLVFILVMEYLNIFGIQIFLNFSLPNGETDQNQSVGDHRVNQILCVTEFESEDLHCSGSLSESLLVSESEDSLIKCGTESVCEWFLCR